MRRTTERVGVAMAACAIFAGIASAQIEDAGDSGAFIRVAEDEQAGTLRLEIATREYAMPRGPGPTVSLAGAVHIADAEFYEQLQAYLDGLDVVLFEGVKPPGAGEYPIEATDARRAQLTTRRIRFIATVVEVYRRDNGAYPDQLQTMAGGLEQRVASLIDGRLTDAWGRPLVYEIERPPLGQGPFDVISLGSDGERGGDAEAADLAFSDQEPISKDEMMADRDDGIQGQLADALGLVFQLNAMDTDGQNWRNSDLSMDEIMDLLDSSGVSGDELFAALDGSSFVSRLIGFGLRLVGSSPTMQATLKIGLLDILSIADAVLAAAPGELGRLIDVLIKDRNAVVMADLERIIAQEPGVQTVGIVYGAGHLIDLQERLTDLGYEPINERWLRAIEVEIAQTGMSAGQVRWFRSPMQRQLERSIEQMGR